MTSLGVHGKFSRRGHCKAMAVQEYASKDSFLWGNSFRIDIRGRRKLIPGIQTLFSELRFSENTHLLRFSENTENSANGFEWDPFAESSRRLSTTSFWALTWFLSLYSIRSWESIIIFLGGSLRTRAPLYWLGPSFSITDRKCLKVNLLQPDTP